MYSPDPWQLLRLLQAQLHDDVLWLRQRLGNADAERWLQRLTIGDFDGARDGDIDERERNLADALARAERLVGGDPEAVHPADRERLDAVWTELHEHAGGAIARLALAACVKLQETAPGTPVTSRIGNFDLLAVLGSGSSGTVYRSRHRDNGMPAAVKLLRIDAHGKNQIERFRREARIASRLGHPAIVRILDSGVHEHGGLHTPYLVSELVEGEPFSAALRGRGERATLLAFAELCDGIAHAHAAAVLHRDLKPGNVLVDQHGHPHVLDFGCARSDDGELGAGTMSGQVIGTPAFMSPEQANGMGSDPRSDQWSLGALLFDALTGEPPHELKNLNAASALRFVAQHAPRRLRQLRPGLGHDLAAVVDKALAMSPADRYDGVQQLGEDVRRLLAGDPVLARPPGVAVSLLRLARRHRLAAAVVLGFALLITTSAVVTTVLWRRALRAEERLDQEAKDALRTVRSVQVIAARLAETLAAAGEQVLLEPTIALAMSMRMSPYSDRSHWLEIEANLREIAGNMALRAGDRAVADDHYRQVLGIRRQLVGTPQGDPSLLARAMVELGDLEQPKSPQMALDHYQEAHAILQRVADSAPTLGHLDDLAWSFHRLAGIAHNDGRHEEAAKLAGKHFQLAERLIAIKVDGLRHFGLATAIYQLRKCEQRNGCGDSDIAEVQRAVVHAELALQSDLERRSFMMAAQLANHELARVRAKRGDGPAMLASEERSMRLLDQLGQDHHDKDAQSMLMHLPRELADVALALAQHDGEARSFAVQLARRAAARLGPETYPWVVGRVAEALGSLDLVDELDRLRQARPDAFR